MLIRKIFYIISLFIYLVLQLSSCIEPYDPFDPIKPNLRKSRLKFVWIKPVYQDSSRIFQSEMYFTGDYIALGTLGYLPENKDKGMAIFHRLTGAKHPNWSQNPCCILEGNEPEIDDFAIGGVNKEIAYFSNRNNLYAYDVSSGQKKWNFPNPIYMPSDMFTTFGDKVYNPYLPGGNGWSTTWGKLARYDAQTGAQEDLFTVNAVPGYDFLIYPPSGYVNSNNDTLVIGISLHYRFSDHNKMVWVYCYNVTQKMMQWENKTFSYNNDWSRNDPIIMDNGKVLIHTFQGANCLDIETGNLVWSKVGLCISTNRTHLLYEDGRVYSRLDDGNLYCWDANTGAQIWKQSIIFQPYDKSNMVIYNGKLYLNSFIDYETNDVVLNCLNAETGELLWRDGGPYGAMFGFMLLDKNLGYLYGHTHGIIYCIDLNKTALYLP
jgi:outer membrane protein assembly factor BamB